MLLSFRHGVSPGAKKQGEVMWPSPPPSFLYRLLTRETSACRSLPSLLTSAHPPHRLTPVSSDSQAPPLMPSHWKRRLTSSSCPNTVHGRENPESSPAVLRQGFTAVLNAIGYATSRLLPKSASIVLASLRGSPYGRKYASPLRSLWPCWTAFLNSLRDILVPSVVVRRSVDSGRLPSLSTHCEEVIDRTASRSTRCGLRKRRERRSEEATWPPPPHSTKTISSSSRPPSWPASSLLLSSLP